MLRGNILCAGVSIYLFKTEDRNFHPCVAVRKIDELIHARVRKAESRNMNDAPTTPASLPLLQLHCSHPSDPEQPVDQLP